MKEIVIQRIREIERQYGVRVLLAVESGSRAWGFASPDSDYDVRFIYVHERDWYLSLLEGRDVIEELDPEGILDVCGWDLKKALTLMGRCNCAFVEWLGSPIVYYRDEVFFREIDGLKDRFFRTLSGEAGMRTEAVHVPHPGSDGRQMGDGKENLSSGPVPGTAGCGSP